MAKLLDTTWKNWTHENLELGVPQEKIFDTLVKNNFDLSDIKNNLNEFNVNKLSKNKQKKVVPQTKVQNTIQSNTYNIIGAVPVEVVGGELELFTIKNFLNKSECEELVNLVKSDMKKSSVSIANRAEGYIDDSVRTSSTCNLVRQKSNVVKDVDERILECIGVHSSRAEAIQGQHYDETQEFKQHTDTFAPNSEEYRLHCENSGGQRTWTFMIYLNETEEGGETRFNLLKNTDNEELLFKPELGMAVVWNNLNKDGSPNRFSLHQGCPVKKGSKTILTKWFRERKI